MMTDEEFARRLQAEENARAAEEAAIEVERRAAGAPESRGEQGHSVSDILVGTKLTYSCFDDKWNSEPVRLRVEEEPFQEGGMRLAYRARELFEDGSASDVVLKCFKEDVLEEGEDEAAVRVLRIRALFALSGSAGPCCCGGRLGLDNIRFPITGFASTTLTRVLIEFQSEPPSRPKRAQRAPPFWRRRQNFGLS